MKKSIEATLRRRAEERLAQQLALHLGEGEGEGEGDATRLVHELQVYAIELEMQNEELQESQSQLLAALERFEVLYEFAPVGYLTLDKFGQIIKMNLTAATLLGDVRAKLFGQPLRTYLIPTPVLHDHLAKACQTSNNVIAELALKKPNNGVSDVQLESRRLTDEPSCTINTIMTDISRRKALERALQQQHTEMEIVLQQQVAVQTAAAIAHELNQPLAAISLFSEAAQHYLNTHAVQGADTLRAALEGIIEQAQRAGQDLHELLKFLQKDEGVYSEAIDLNHLICAALKMVQRNGFDGFHHMLELEPNLPPVLGNYVHIEKVLVNLIRNSVEAMRLAAVPIANITIMVRTMAEWNMAQVTVRDTGPGLSPEAAKRVFRPFFTTKPKGIGMGLAVSRALIEANGGQLWVEPEVGSGATFHFTLPFAESIA